MNCFEEVAEMKSTNTYDIKNEIKRILCHSFVMRLTIVYIVLHFNRNRWVIHLGDYLRHNKASACDRSSRKTNKNKKEKPKPKFAFCCFVGQSSLHLVSYSKIPSCMIRFRQFPSNKISRNVFGLVNQSILCLFLRGLFLCLSNSSISYMSKTKCVCVCVHTLYIYYIVYHEH